MAPVPYACQVELAPYTSWHLLQHVWRRLYPHGDDPVYRVYRDRLAASVFEYHAMVTLRCSSTSSTYTRSSRSGFASTPAQAIQFAVFEILVELCYNEIQMQTHPGFYYYPSLHDDGRVRFPMIDPVADSPASHLSRYITASYLLIHELARELTRARTALVAARSSFVPPSIGFTPVISPVFGSPATPVTPSSDSSTLTVTPHSTPIEWDSLLTTPAAPMLQSHPAPTPEGEPSRQRRRVTFNPEVSVNTISSGSESGSGEDPAGPAEQ